MTLHNPKQLEKILREGFEEYPVPIEEVLALYVKGNSRLIYDLEKDKIVVQYKVEDKE